MFLDYVSCGGMNIPEELANITRLVYTMLLVLTPVILIVVGSKDLLMSVIGNDEAAIKKGRDIFFKRFISAGIVFFVLSITSLVIKLVATDSQNESYAKCISCLINDKSKCGATFKIEE